MVKKKGWLALIISIILIVIGLSIVLYLFVGDGDKGVSTSILIPALIGFLGSFTGFGLTSLFQTRYDEKKTEDERKALCEIIQKEMQRNVEKRLDVNAINTEGEYETVAFESSIHSGYLLLLQEREWFAELLSVYNDLRCINGMCKLVIAQKEEDRDQLIKIIEDQMNTASKRIARLLSKMKNNEGGTTDEQ